MEHDGGAESEQAALWKGSGGLGWLGMQAVTDGLFQPLEDVLVDAVAASAATCVLDVGCGAGATTLAIARQLAPHGTRTGVDISEPLITAAERRAVEEGSTARFILGDAQRYAFAAEHFDAIVSRFGVMFFDDPVRAFANLRGAASREGILRCLTWRGAGENPFMTAAESAAAPLIAIPPRADDAPGQFGLADAGRVRAILEAGGWTDVALEALDVECTMPRAQLVPYLTHLGPLGRALATVDAPSRSRVIEAVLPAFDAYADGDDVRFTAACWMVAAHA